RYHHPRCSSFLVPSTSTSTDSWAWPTSSVRSGRPDPASAVMSAHRASRPTPLRASHQRIYPMAGRVLSRRTMREEHDQAERIDQEAGEIDEAPDTRAEVKVKKARSRKATAKPAGAKPPAKPRARKRAAKQPPRMLSP